LAELRVIEDDAALRATFLAQEKARVTLGGTTLASQVQAEQDLLEVQVRLAEAAGRREVARLSLMLAEGQLLRLHGVETPLPTEP
jgi:outer membrane protein TolC